jgi:ABC-type multidrug transport system fused ATPase/permease subunit
LGCDSATDKDMYRAAKKANAHDFIISLPDVRRIFDLILLFLLFIDRDIKL